MRTLYLKFEVSCCNMRNRQGTACTDDIDDGDDDYDEYDGDHIHFHGQNSSQEPKLVMPCYDTTDDGDVDQMQDAALVKQEKQTKHNNVLKPVKQTVTITQIAHHLNNKVSEELQIKNLPTFKYLELMIIKWQSCLNG